MKSQDSGRYKPKNTERSDPRRQREGRGIKASVKTAEIDLRESLFLVLVVDKQLLRSITRSE